MGDIKKYHPFLIGVIMDIEIDTILELKTKVKTSDSIYGIDYEIHLGLYVDHGGYEHFGIIIVDKRGLKSKKYVSTFSSQWCSDEYKEWFLVVLGKQMWEMIKESRNGVIKEIKELKNQWDKLIGE